VKIEAVAQAGRSYAFQANTVADDRVLLVLYPGVVSKGLVSLETVKKAGGWGEVKVDPPMFAKRLAYANYPTASHDVIESKDFDPNQPRDRNGRWLGVAIYDPSVERLQDAFRWDAGALDRFIEKNDTGSGCDDIAAAVEDRWSIPQVFGRYNSERHSWNETDTGVIVDLARYVFGEPASVFVMKRSDKRASAYSAETSSDDDAWDFKALVRHVRTPEGAAKYGQRIGEVIRADIPKIPFIHKSDLSNGGRERTREVSKDDYVGAWLEGERRLTDLRNRQSSPKGLYAKLEGLTCQAWQSTRSEWGGMTIDSHTGEPLAADAQAYALTVKPPGMDSVTVPIDTDEAAFDQAMHDALERFSKELRYQQHYLGIFRNDDIGMIEFDPVLVVDTLYDVETIGAYTHAVGGAYCFADGLGYWPPHIKETKDAGLQGTGTVAHASHSSTQGGTVADRARGLAGLNGRAGAGRPEVKTRHVRDVGYWHLPYGTPLAEGEKPGDRQQSEHVDASPLGTSLDKFITKVHAEELKIGDVVMREGKAHVITKVEVKDDGVHVHTLDAYAKPLKYLSDRRELWEKIANIATVVMALLGMFQVNLAPEDHHEPNHEPTGVVQVDSRHGAGGEHETEHPEDPELPHAHVGRDDTLHADASATNPMDDTIRITRPDGKIVTVNMNYALRLIERSQAYQQTGMKQAALLLEEKIIRHVRTPEGAKKYGQRIGTIIVRDVPLTHLQVVGEHPDASSGWSYLMSTENWKRNRYEIGPMADGGFGIYRRGAKTPLMTGDDEEDLLEDFDTHLGSPKKPARVVSPKAEKYTNVTVTPLAGKWKVEAPGGDVYEVRKGPSYSGFKWIASLLEAESPKAQWGIHGDTPEAILAELDLNYDSKWVEKFPIGKPPKKQKVPYKIGAPAADPVRVEYASTHYKEDIENWYDNYLSRTDPIKKTMSKSQFVAVVQRNLVSEFKKAEKSAVTYVPDIQVLQGILKDGRLKSQFETGTSEGLLDRGLRRRVESKEYKQLNVPREIKDELRPIYGSTEPDPKHLSSASQYGTVILKLKPEIADRTTMCLGDSLDSGLTPIPIKGFSSDEVWAAVSTDFLESAMADAYTSAKTKVTGKPPKDKKRGWWDLPEYTEIQVHGGLTLDDIASIGFLDTTEVSNEEFKRIKQLLDRAGIPHYIEKRAR
jgi:hypothetical protein